jgi:hypothetical protein
MNIIRSRVLLILGAGLVLLLGACNRDSSETTQVDTVNASAVYRPDVGMLTADYARFRKAQISNPAYHLQLDLQEGSAILPIIYNWTCRKAATILPVP